jgi:hypothetical protein
MDFRVLTGLIILLSACSPRPVKQQVKIVLKPQGLYVLATGIEPAMLAEMGRDSGSLQTLMPVFRMPKDTDLKNYQQPQPGVYRVEGNAVVFSPDTPFTAGHTYFLRFYDFSEAKSAADMIRQGRKLGSKIYTDLSFTK